MQISLQLISKKKGKSDVCVIGAWTRILWKISQFALANKGICYFKVSRVSSQITAMMVGAKERKEGKRHTFK